MADRLTFELSMMDAMSGALRPVVANLDKTEDAMNSVRISADYLEESLAHAADRIKKTGGTLKDTQALLAAQRELAAGGGAAVGAFEGSALGRVLSGLEEMPKRATPQVKTLRMEWGNMFHSFAGFRREADGGWIFNVADGIRSIGSAFAGAARMAYDFTAATLKAVGGAEDLGLAARLNLGAGGVATMGGVTDLFGGGRTRFDDDTVKRGLLPIMRAGVRDQRLLEDLATAAGDIEAMTAGETKMSAALAALGKMRVKRDFGEKQLEALGLNADDVYAALARQIGKNLKTTKALAGEGKIAGDVLLGVVLNKVAEAQGGELGRATLESGKTLGATLQRLADLPENMLKNTAGSPALKGLQQALDGFVTQMSGPLGASVMSALADALRAAVPVMSGLARAVTYMLGGSQEEIDQEALGTKVGTKRLGGAGIVTNLAGEAVALGGGPMNVRMERRDMLDALRRAGLNGLQINDLIGQLGEGGALKVAMAQVSKEMGVAVGEGFIAGINAKVPVALDSGGKLAAAATDGVTAEAEIHSPSRVAMRLGGHYAEGLAIGIESGQGRVSDATAALLSVPETAARGGAGAGAGGEGDTLHMTFLIPGYRGDGDGGETVVNRFIRRVVRHYAAAEPA